MIAFLPFLDESPFQILSRRIRPNRLMQQNNTFQLNSSSVLQFDCLLLYFTLKSSAEEAEADFGDFESCCLVSENCVLEVIMPDALTNPQLSKPTFQEGVDNLWRFQLRKEHAALLEKANANIKYLEQLAAETNKSKKDFDERMAALEGKILSFKNEDKKFRHGFEQYVEDMAMLKTQMGNAMDKLETHDRQLDGGISISLSLC